MKKLPKQVQASVEKIHGVITGKTKECTLNKKDLQNITTALLVEADEMLEHQIKASRDKLSQMKRGILNAFKNKPTHANKNKRNS